jgi:formate hydrogenlyase subunit 3/multisubunit Na+/H+ antiporter MnhD subunit
VALFAQLLGVLGSLAIVWGALQALRQQRLKLLIAYSTVSQIGYPFLLFPLMAAPGAESLAWRGGLLFAVSHGVAKSAAFLAAGVLMTGVGHDRLPDLAETARRYPVAVMTLAMAGISLMGLPPSGGFVAKWMMLKATFIAGQWWYAVVIIAGALLAAAYMVKAVECTLRQGDGAAVFRPVSWRMQAAGATLALIALALGFLAHLPLNLMLLGAP